MTRVTPVVSGGLAHPLYVFMQLFFVLSQPLLNFAHIFSQEELCIFCSTNLQLYVLRLCTQVCACNYEGLYWLTFCANSCTFCMPWVHFECSVCTFVHQRKGAFVVHIVHTFVNLQILCFFCTFRDQFAPVCASCISPMAVNTVYSQCHKRIKSGSIFGAGAAHNKWSVIK